MILKIIFDNPTASTSVTFFGYHFNVNPLKNYSIMRLNIPLTFSLKKFILFLAAIVLIKLKRKFYLVDYLLI